MLDENIFARHFPELQYAHRKKISLTQVARTIADIDKSKDIKARHLDEAYELSIKYSSKLQILIRSHLKNKILYYLRAREFQNAKYYFMRWLLVKMDGLS